MRKILIVKSSSLGDIAQAFVILPFLKERDPTCEIHWIMEAPFAGLGDQHPMIDRVLRVHTKKWRKKLFNKEIRQEVKQFKSQLQSTVYDEVFDLQGNMKSALFTFWAKSTHKVGYSWRYAAEWPAALPLNHRLILPAGKSVRERYLYLLQTYYKDFYYSLEGAKPACLQTTEEQKQAVEAFLEPLKGFPVLAIAPGTQWRNKELRVESLEYFLKHLLERDSLRVVLTWGSDSEKRMVDRLARAFPQEVFIFPKSPIPVVQYLLSRVSIFIGMDSFLLHLNASTGTPSYGIFGPSLGKIYTPPGDHHAYEQGSCPYGEHFDFRCKYLRSCTTGLCCRGLTGEHILERFYPFWQKFGAGRPLR